MKDLVLQSWHYLVGLAGIGAVAGLAATGTVSGNEALPIITAITGTLVGGGLGATVPKGTTTTGA